MGLTGLKPEGMSYDGRASRTKFASIFSAIVNMTEVSPEDAATYLYSAVKGNIPDGIHLRY